MRKDPTEFRKRFADWKAGKKVYDAGLPHYDEGTSSFQAIGAPATALQFMDLPAPTATGIKTRIYDNLSAFDYGDLSKVSTRLANVLLFNRNEKLGDIESLRDDQLAQYLQIPQNRRHQYKNKRVVKPAIYSGTKGDFNNNGGTYKIDLTDEEKRSLVEDADFLPIGKNAESFVLSPLFGPHTVGRGVDQNGEYVSYWDRYDLNPFDGGSSTIKLPKLIEKMVKGKDFSFGLGKPFDLYDRVYLNDYYGVKREDVANDKHSYYGGWLPEVTIVGKKHTRNEPRKK